MSNPYLSFLNSLGGPSAHSSTLKKLASTSKANDPQAQRKPTSSSSLNGSSAAKSSSSTNAHIRTSSSSSASLAGKHHHRHHDRSSRPDSDDEHDRHRFRDNKSDRDDERKGHKRQQSRDEEHSWRLSHQHHHHHHHHQKSSSSRNAPLDKHDRHSRPRGRSRSRSTSRSRPRSPVASSHKHSRRRSSSKDRGRSPSFERTKDPTTAGSNRNYAANGRSRGRSRSLERREGRDRGRTRSKRPSRSRSRSRSRSIPKARTAARSPNISENRNRSSTRSPSRGKPMTHSSESAAEGSKAVATGDLPSSSPYHEHSAEADERSVPPHEEDRLSTPPPTVPQRRHFHEMDDTLSISTLSSPMSSSSISPQPHNYLSSSAQSTPITGSPARKEMTPLKKRRLDTLAYQDSAMSSSASCSPFSSAPSSPDRHFSVPVMPVDVAATSGSNGSSESVASNDLHSSKSLAMELFGSDVEDDDDKFTKKMRGVDGEVPAATATATATAAAAAPSSRAPGGEASKKVALSTANKDRAAGVGIAKKRIPKREPKIVELEVTKAENGEDIVRTIKSTPLSSRGSQNTAGGSKTSRKASIDGGNQGQERRMSIIHSDQIVAGAMERYKNHFHMLVEDSDSTVASSPSSTSADTMHISVDYPGVNGREKFTLMKPFLSRSKTETDDKDEYNPIEDLVCTVRVIASFFFPPDEYETLFGTPTEGLLRNLTKFRNRKDGAQFLKTVEEFNQLMRRCKTSGEIAKQIEDYGSSLPYELVVHILQQVYSRTVASKASKLNQYEAFSNNVYGEILPVLTKEFIQRTKLGKDKVFVDLGCGIGNVVLQVALQTGAESYGIEIMDNPAKFAKKQAREFEARTKAYGLTHGKVTMMHGDFLDTPGLAAILARADVVLVNNYAFNSDLNQSLLQLFLDLKEGCKIISLKTFVSLDHKITVRNAGSVESILKVKKYPYYTNAVSWTHNGGEYFIATVDRTEVQAFWTKAMANPAMLDDAPVERRVTSRRRHS